MLLALVALCSVLGTTIPQQHSAQELFAGNHPMLSAILKRMGFFDLFHSPLFLLLEAGLTLNLIVCTWNRFPIWWRRFHYRVAPPEPDGEVLPKQMILTGSIEENADRIEKRFKELYGKSVRSISTQTVWINWSKNALSTFGVPIVHLGVLLIIAGAVTGAIFGFEGRAMITEGGETRTIFLKGGETQDLDFTVKCNRFTVIFYENGAPREFKSDLEFSRNGQVLKRAAVKVNEPVAFEGIRFYQESYGTTPDKIVLEMAQQSGKKTEIRIGAGETIKIPGTEASIRILRAEDNLMSFGPGVKIAIESDNREDAFWVFKNIEQLKAEYPGLLEKVPLFNPDRFKPYHFYLKQIGTKNYTGLQVSRDPGIPVIFAGFIVVILGCILLYLLPYRRIGIGLEAEEKGVRIGIVCEFEKNKSRQKREYEKIMNLIKQIRG